MPVMRAQGNSNAATTARPSAARMLNVRHAAGVANGGASIEDPPGVRTGAMGALFLAYLRDPAGNKICALHRMAR